MSRITEEQFTKVQRLGDQLIRFKVWQSKADGRALVKHLFQVESSKRLSSGQATVLLFQMRELLIARLAPAANMVPAEQIRWV